MTPQTSLTINRAPPPSLAEDITYVSASHLALALGAIGVLMAGTLIFVRLSQIEDGAKRRSLFLRKLIEGGARADDVLRYSQMTDPVNAALLELTQPDVAKDAAKVLRNAISVAI